MCAVITPITVIIQSSNKIVKFIENVMILIKPKYGKLLFRRENRIVSNKIIFEKYK